MSNLLRKFAEDVRRAGLVGEEVNAQVVFLTAASASLPNPLNLTVCGASAAGKNYLIETAAKFLPEQRKKFLTGMTPKTLMHSEKTEFQHKAVFIAEYEGVHGADYSIRTLQSEQRIEWEFVDTADGIKKKRNSVLGPAAFIQATTRVSLHPENETRLLFIHIDESPEQTQAINLRQGQAAAGKVEPCPASVFVSWHEFFLGLTENRITIPFAEQLSASMPVQRIRSRRDFPKLLALIETSAYLHQASRPRNPEGLILAVPEDYQIARVLFASCYDTTLEKSTGEFLTAVKHESEGFQFSVAEMMQKTGWKRTKAYEVLARLEDAGIVIPAEQRGSYLLARKAPEPKLTLPEKLRLTADIFRISAQIPPSVALRGE